MLIFDDSNASQLIEELKPQVVVKGEASMGKEILESAAIKKVGARVEYLSHFDYSKD